MSIQEETAESFPYQGGDFFSVRSLVQAQAVGQGLLRKMRDPQDAQHSPVFEKTPNFSMADILAIDLELSTRHKDAK